MRRALLALALIASVTACKAPAATAAPEPALTEAQKAGIADTLRAQAQKFADDFASKDANDIAGLFAETTHYFDNGNIYPSRAKILEIATGFFSRYDHLKGHWQPSEVIVLDKDAGVFWGVFQADDAMWGKGEEIPAANRGKPLWVEGQSWTFVFQRQPSGRFEITMAHQSPLPPGRIDQYKTAATTAAAK